MCSPDSVARALTRGPRLATLILAMSHDAIRERVLAIFAQHRIRPDAPYEEDHFLDYLPENPEGKKGFTSNRFAGLRRRNAFIQEVEREFMVCFGTKDFERNYSLPHFVERVAALQASPRSSHAALQARFKARSGLGAVLTVDLVLVGLALVLRASPWLAVMLVLAAAGFSSWALTAILGAGRHNRALGRRLGLAAGGAGPSDQRRAGG
jgi:hypothetical protein